MLTEHEPSRITWTEQEYEVEKAVKEYLEESDGGNTMLTDHERELANLREQIAVLEEQFKVACERSEEWKARAEKAEDAVARQALLLVRKSEALGVFADPKCWVWRDLPIDRKPQWVWNGDGGGAYSNPMTFARKEASADEPTD